MTIMNSRRTAHGAASILQWHAGNRSAFAVLLMSAALVGCKSTESATGSDSGPEVTKLYTPTYATDARNSMAAAYAEEGASLESKTKAIRQAFGDDTAGEPDTYTLDDTRKVELAKSGAGYVFKYGDAEFTLTDADYVSDPEGGYYDKSATNSDGDLRFLASLYSLTGDTKGDLASPTRVMVPLGFGVRMQGNNAGGVEPGEADSTVEGFMIAGVETNPSDMPTSGTATYNGQSRFDIYAKESTYGTSDVQQIRYSGDSAISANFDAGTVSGEALLERRRVRLADDTTTTDDISGAGVKVSFDSTLTQNGFEIDDLKANAAAEAELASQNIGQMEVGGEGRFYGRNAESVGVIVAGSSEDHVMTGTMFGDK
ncbi:transferrin-binding protein-like solute binding protein [Shinella sp. BYT-45]|uniref:transferrin-binding protein-like solute binding protein n=1 Tax=Shinella sp. BYT-45 TaxID=3377377 RepID=UPI0039813763